MYVQGKLWGKIPLGSDYDGSIQRSSLNHLSDILYQSKCGHVWSFNCTQTNKEDYKNRNLHLKRGEKMPVDFNNLISKYKAVMFSTKFVTALKCHWQLEASAQTAWPSCTGSVGELEATCRSSFVNFHRLPGGFYTVSQTKKLFEDLGPLTLVLGNDDNYY